MVNIADIHKSARSVVHATLSLDAVYSDDVVSGVTIKARWTNKANKAALVGDLETDGYGQVYDPVDKIIFDVTDANTVGIKRGGHISFPDYDGITFVLTELMPSDGPITVTWASTRAG